MRETESQRQHLGGGAEQSSFLWSGKILPIHVMEEWILGEIPPFPRTPSLACLKVYKEGEPHGKSQEE